MSGGSKVRARQVTGALAVASLLVVIVVQMAMAGPVSNAAGFEGDDGNLAPQAPINFDWNSFQPTTWTGTAPNRTATKTVAGWALTGIEDAQATTSDSAFAGGVKQDTSCASVIGAKAPNKDDLRRVYVTSNTVGGDIYLALAWVRIPQNTTSPSAHIGFEFNQSQTACGGPGGLVTRTAGDMLIVYDFEGSSTEEPTLTLRRWVTSGACEVSSNSAPCWGPASNLTASGFAEAAVNTGGSVTDQIGPITPQTLGTNEFGEAIINLTDAGVFSNSGGGTVCTAFGKTYAVSRSSGNSATAQMKDLVGPGNINITNCGRVIIRKVTDPSPDPTSTSFAYTTTGGLSPSTFNLTNGQSRDYGGSVPQGAYSVTETDPGPDFTLSNLNCSASTISHGTTIQTDAATRTVSFNLKPLDTVDCTFTNTLNKNNPTASTDPTAIPQDSATVSGLNTTGVVDGAADKELTFTLYPGAGCTGTAVYTDTVTVTANTTYSTDNDGTGPDGFTITSDGDWFWKVVYDGDSRNNPFQACNEAIDVNLTPSP